MPERRQMGNALEGLSIVISGTFARHSREEYKKMIEDHGGKIWATSKVGIGTEIHFVLRKTTA